MTAARVGEAHDRVSQELERLLERPGLLLDLQGFGLQVARPGTSRDVIKGVVSRHAFDPN